MYFIKRIIQLILLLGLIWLSFENYDVRVEGISLFGNDIIGTSVIFVILASLLTGIFITALFAAMNEWKIHRDNKKAVKVLKNNIKDLEDKLNIENAELKKEILSLKEILKNGK